MEAKVVGARRANEKVNQLWKVLWKWRVDAYECRAKTCACESKWHMRTGPTSQLVRETDGALEDFEPQS